MYLYLEDGPLDHHLLLALAVKVRTVSMCVDVWAFLVYLYLVVQESLH